MDGEAKLSPQVSNPIIDEIYDSAKSAGALGGKLMGAGGGGMLLLYVPVEKQVSLRRKLSGLIHVPFLFEQNGSRIIFQDKHKRYAEGERWRTNSNTKFVDVKDIDIR